MILSPESALDFKKKNIPPIEYYVDGILQKQGKLMVSAKSNVGKSFFVINLLTSICRGEDKFLGRFPGNGNKPNVLYVDLEMGNSALQTRLQLMGSATDLDNLYLQYAYGWDMLDPSYQEALENVIGEKDIHIVAFDPLGSLWNGDENKREQVKKLTDYFDSLINNYNVSICLTHHWRKTTKDFREGGEMAAGSYGWGKWLDNHVTLQGNMDSLIVYCDKSRNQERWEQFRIKINPSNMCFEYAGDFQNKVKFTESDMGGIFASFGKERVSMPEFLKKGEGVCSRSTIYELLTKSKIFAVDKSTKPHCLYKRAVQSEFLVEPSEDGDG